MAGTHRASAAYADPLETSGGSERERWGGSLPRSKWNHKRRTLGPLTVGRSDGASHRLHVSRETRSAVLTSRAILHGVSTGETNAISGSGINCAA